jgi:excisionase family DNA binding protein
MSISSEASGHIESRSGDVGLKRKAYSIKETGMLLGISQPSVRRLIKRGLLRPNRALRHLLVPASEIDRFLQQ